MERTTLAGWSFSLSIKVRITHCFDQLRVLMPDLAHESIELLPAQGAVGIRAYDAFSEFLQGGRRRVESQLVDFPLERKHGSILGGFSKGIHIGDFVECDAVARYQVPHTFFGKGELESILVYDLPLCELLGYK